MFNFTRKGLDLDKNNLYNVPLDSLYSACLNKNSDECISVKTTCDVFLSIFPNNYVLEQARNNLNQSDKTIKSQAKITVKSEIHDLLSKIRKCTASQAGSNLLVDKIEELNNYPRLAEALYALSLGIKPVKISTGNINAVFRLYDRRGKKQGKALAIIKSCRDPGASNEVAASEQLGKLNQINVKQTLKCEFEIAGIKIAGIFQKFIKGKMIREVAEPTDAYAVEQLHFIGVFDLINRNSDRNPGNIMIDKQGKVWAIDHESIDGYADAYKMSNQNSMAWCQASYQPFSPKVIDHIKALDINQHILESIRDSNNRAHIENMIGFLKWAVSEERKIPLTLAQIHWVLAKTTVIPTPNDNEYKKMLEKSLKSRLETKAISCGWLEPLFPQIEQLINQSCDPDIILAKYSRLGSSDKIYREIFLDVILENQNTIVFLNTANHPHLRNFALSVLFKKVAEGTKYYDKEHQSFTQDLETFLKRVSSVR